MNRKRMEVHFLIYWESSTEKKSGSFTLAKFSSFNISELIKYFLKDSVAYTWLTYKEKEKINIKSTGLEKNREGKILAESKQKKIF